MIMEIETEQISNEIPIEKLRISTDSPSPTYNRALKHNGYRPKELWRVISKPTDINLLPTFQIKSGLTVNLDSLETPSDFFSQIFDNKIIGDLLEYTNINANANHKKAKYKTLQNRKRLAKLANSHERKWKDVDELEMKAFVGIILYMGIISKPSIHEYWTRSHLFETPGIRCIMSRDRFYQILKYFKLY